MKETKKVWVIIPAFNEENSIGLVLNAIPDSLVEEVIVVDNNSKDATAANAKVAGASVIKQTMQGYGNACLKGIEFLENKADSDSIVVFLDADFSDHPEEMNKLLEPIFTNGFDMVIGSRALGNREKGSMMPQQLFGNWLATSLIRVFYKHVYSDLGPFRAIRYDKLLQLQMCDKTYGWTVEMQLKAAKMKMKITEVPVSYRKRVGVSKISGTVKGTILAGYRIIYTIFKHL